MACSSLLVSITPECSAYTQPGGVQARVWTCHKSDLSYTIDGTSKVVNSVTLATGINMAKIISRKDKQSGVYELQVNDSSTNFGHTANLIIYHSTQLEREAIEALVNSEDVVLFFETNAGKIEVYGLGNGLKATSGSGGTGTAQTDSTAFTLALTGTEQFLPKQVLIGGTLATTIAALDAA